MTPPTRTSPNSNAAPKGRSRPLVLTASSSAELATAARGGDDRAAGELYRRTMRRARAAARGYCADADADDAVAEGLSRALGRLHQLNDPTAVEAWMIRSAVRAAIDLSRQRRRQSPTASVETLSESVHAPAESAAERALTLLEHTALATVLRDLRPEPRMLLQLRYGAGFSIRRIADTLGRPDGTVRRQCLEARRMAGQRYLGHLLRPPSGPCAQVTELMCRATYRRLSDHGRRRVDQHLRRCRACRDRRQELSEVLRELGVRRGSDTATGGDELGLG